MRITTCLMVLNDEPAAPSAMAISHEDDGGEPARAEPSHEEDGRSAQLGPDEGEGDGEHADDGQAQDRVQDGSPADPLQHGEGEDAHQEEDEVVEDLALCLGKFDHFLPEAPADCS